MYSKFKMSYTTMINIFNIFSKIFYNANGYCKHPIGLRGYEDSYISDQDIFVINNSIFDSPFIDYREFSVSDFDKKYTLHINQNILSNDENELAKKPSYDFTLHIMTVKNLESETTIIADNKPLFTDTKKELYICIAAEDFVSDNKKILWDVCHNTFYAIFQYALYYDSYEVQSALSCSSIGLTNKIDMADFLANLFAYIIVPYDVLNVPDQLADKFKTILVRALHYTKTINDCIQIVSEDFKPFLENSAISWISENNKLDI